MATMPNKFDWTYNGHVVIATSDDGVEWIGTVDGQPIGKFRRAADVYAQAVHVVFLREKPANYGILPPKRVTRPCWADDKRGGDTMTW
jgi:hypothetical protein